MDTSNSIRRARPLLGTFVEIAAAGAARGELQQAVDDAFAAVAQVHRLMSFHDPQSDVSRLNREAFAARGRACTPGPIRSWKRRSSCNRKSAGVFDITVAPFCSSAACCLAALAIPCRLRTGSQPPARSNCSAIAGFAIGSPGIRIDLGGIAKGFAVDRALDVLRGHGLARGLVNAGGDLAAFGPEAGAGAHSPSARTWPRRSAGRRSTMRRWRQAAGPSIRCDSPEAGDCAVVDPTHARPVRAIAGATVRAPCCMIADALTKVVMIAGEAAERLLQRYRASALFVLESGDVWITPDWQDAVRLAA